MKTRALTRPTGLQELNLELGVCDRWNFGLKDAASHFLSPVAISRPRPSLLFRNGSTIKFWLCLPNSSLISNVIS